MYWWVFLGYKDGLSAKQVILGYIVGGREGLYFALTVLACFSCPAYLIVDAKRSMQESTSQMLLYALAPEKFVALVIGGRSGGGLFLLGVCLLADLAGIAALAVPLLDHLRSPMALEVIYGLNTAGLAFTLLWFLPAHLSTAADRDHQHIERLQEPLNA